MQLVKKRLWLARAFEHLIFAGPGISVLVLFGAGDAFMGKCKNHRVESWSAALVAVVLFATSTHAAISNFAVFSDVSGTRPFLFANNATSGSISASAPVTFNFTATTGLGTADRPATLTISTTGGASTATPASLVGSNQDQPITALTTLSLIENSTGKNLLTMTFTGDLVGKTGAASAQISGSDSTGNTVNFTSDYLTFTPPGNSYGLSLASMNPTLAIGAGGFLSSFLADIDGQFSGSAAAVPEPAVLGMVAVASLMALRRRR